MRSHVIAFMGSGALILGTSACATTAMSGYCQNGWTVQREGSSTLWSPTVREREAISGLISKDSEPLCYHRLASGDYLLVFKNPGPQYIQFYDSEGSFKVRETGFVITAD